MSLGNYSISISYGLPWKKKPEPAVTDKKRKKTLRPIINPIFEKCANLTEDKFWQTLFMDCARGKFPRGFTFKNGLITYKKGSKSFKLEISDSPAAAYSATMNFLQTVAGIMSVTDRQKLQKLEEEKLLTELEKENDITWKQVRTEKLKDILINEFIKDLATKMNFNEEENKELTTTVKKGFILKYFGSNNVKMKDGKIIEIEGLIYNEETKEYEIDEDYVQAKSIRKSNKLGIEKGEDKPMINFMELWTKYLENLSNKRVKKLHSYSSSYSTRLETSSKDKEESQDSLELSSELNISRDSLGESLRDSLGESLRDSLGESLRDSLGESFRDSLSKSSLQSSFISKDSLKQSFQPSFES